MEFLSNSSFVASVLVLSIAGYCFSLAIYRLFFSPLSKFPGPALAALTIYYEAYYDIIKGGQYTFKIKELHKKYGPIVRINPYELHIDDPEYYEKLYTREGRWDKSAYYCNSFGNTVAEVFTMSHDLHRIRRASVAPFFSKQKILSLEPMIQRNIGKFCERIRLLKGTGNPLPLRLAYEALTTDIITEYCMAKSYGHLDQPYWDPKYHDMITKLGAVMYLSRLLPFLQPILELLPSWVVLKLDPGMGSWVEFQEDCLKEVYKLQQLSAKSAPSGQEKSYPTVFHEIMYSNEIPQSEKSPYRMKCEAMQFVSAGTDTVSNTMHVITYHVIDNPDILQRLRKEILTVQPNPTQPVKFSQLERLPYLTSVILEGLRLGYGVSTRLPRIAPDRVIKYKDWEIPPGTPVGMTSVLMHQNESVFPEPARFNPDRWVDLKERQRLEKYLASFSRGTRQCLGINLAYAELYTITAAIFSRFDLELYNTTYEDHVEIASDMFFPHPRTDAGDFKVLVK